MPHKTCLSCRSRRAKADMIRLTVNSNGSLILDISGKGQGRGAYVCFRKGCWERPELVKRLEGVFRKAGLMVFHSQIRFEWPPNSS